MEIKGKTNVAWVYWLGRIDHSLKPGLGWAIVLSLFIGLNGCVSTTVATQPPRVATIAAPTPTRKPTPTQRVGTSTPGTGTRQGDLAPDFSLVALNGETVSLSQFRGQPVLINFWAVWCAFCRLEMPDIQKAYDEYQDEGLVVLGVNVGEDAQTAEPFIQEMGVTFSILFDRDARVMRVYRLRGLPTTVIVDREGVIRAIHLGLIEYQDIVGYLEEMGISS